MIGPTKEGRIILPDDRVLAFLDQGDPAGQPVFFFHGWPGSRLQAPPDPSVLSGIRLITVDRPGLGQSSPHPHRRLLDWPADVAQLADSLGLDRFAAAGVSGGGPYALACAAALPERVTRLALCSSLAPLDQPDMWIGLLRPAKLTFRLARRSPRLILPGLALFRQAVHLDRRDTTRVVSRFLPPADRQIMARPEVAAMLSADVREALTQGAEGLAQDLCLLSRPWGFHPAQVRQSTTLFHGLDDNIVPARHGQWLSSRLPHCQAFFLPQAGHFFILNQLPEILSTLREAA